MQEPTLFFKCSVRFYFFDLLFKCFAFQINRIKMKLTKQQRIELRNKYQGRCAYCGDLLGERWHADHIEPIVRNWWNGTCEHPERNTLENFNPSCPSCNIVKSSMSLDSFRKILGGFITSLNRDSTQYKFAKRYGLLEEKEIEVKFWFEKRPRK